MTQGVMRSQTAPAGRGLEVKPHSLLDDVYGICVGVLFAATGVLLLQAAGLITGGVAGIALLGSYMTGQSVGLLFLLINVPFFLFGYLFMGARFTAKSLVGSAMIMALLKLIPNGLVIGHVDPMVAALGGGTFCGMGILALARHGAGLGGTGIVTLWLQKRYAINAGRTQVMIDSVILMVALTMVEPERVGWSALSAVAMSSMVMAWHRAGRYFGS
ncbi:YitT family protein [Massilia sp. ST3]|uniref:YitT family protein n=1 Tax=Massilia sp. ST3 TaxID=2824903 RepID=UPI001B81B576|nr:YitT family protein [Massilia sp. ST3]MBQ5950332.1 YitT family protein [Massilia sp. ST3]